MKNWKTTIAGLGAILTGVGKIVTSNFTIDLESISIISAGIGLIFAKDKNVTGGSTKQF